MFKQKELLVIGCVAIFSAVLSFVISSALFGSPKKHPIKVPEVQPISSSFPDIRNDSDYKTIFNSNALNPTQLIQIGGNNNQQPLQQSTNQ